MIVEPPVPLDPLPDRPARPWAMLAILQIFYVFAFIDRTVISMIVEPVRRDLQITDTQISLLIGLGFSIAFALGGLPLGWMADRYPRRWLAWGGVTFWALAETLCGVVRGFAQLFGARLLVGFGEAALAPVAHSMIADAFPARRLSLALSIYTLGIPIGAGLSLLIGGVTVHLVSQHAALSIPVIGAVKPWQCVFIATGLPGLALALLIFLVPEPLRAGGPATGTHADASWAELRAFLKLHRRLWLSIAMVFGSMLSVFGALSVWLPSYMTRNFHWNAAQYGVTLGLMSIVAGSAGLLFSGWLIDRMLARGIRDAHLRYYGIAILVTAPLSITGLLASDVRVFLGLIWTAYFALTNCINIGAAMVQATSPSRLRGRLAALFMSILAGLTAAIVGATLPALIADRVLHDNVRLGRALALTVALCAPIALLGVALGLAPLRQAMQAAEEAWRNNRAPQAKGTGPATLQCHAP